MAFESYSGLLTAYPYAILESDSLTFRLYALVSGLIAAFTAILLGAGLIVMMGSTAAASGGVFTLSRMFLFVVGILVVVPIVAPVLFVARRHRREIAVADGYDLALGAMGFVFLFGLYVALIISEPSDLQNAPPAAVAPLVGFLRSLPRITGLVPPTLAAAGIWLVHRRLAEGAFLD